MASVFQISWKKASHHHITDYVTFLLDTSDLAPATIRSRISAIAFYYKTRLNCDPTKSFATDLLLKHLEKSSQNRKRLPINKDILEKLLLSLYSYKSKFLFHAFYLMYKIMYSLALRISELLHYSKKFDHALRYKDIKQLGNVVWITIRSGKHNIRPMKYSLDSSFRFLWHLKEFLRLRGSAQGPLFCFKNGKPITRNFFTRQLKEDLCSLGLHSTRYNSHSFRIDRTSDLALQGASDRQIALIGRWQSDAFRDYIRPTHIAL